MKLVPLRHLSSVPITNGLGLAGSNDEPTWPRYVRTTDIAGPRSLRKDVFASQPPEVAAAAMLERGDILMTAAGASIGKSVTFDEDQPACYAGFLVRLRPLSPDAGRFLGYWMQSKHYWDQIAVGAVKSTIDNFSASKYRSLRAPQPRLDEQKAIADFLDRETARIDTLIDEQQRLIELLTERKQVVASVSLGTRVGQGHRLKWHFVEVDDRAGSAADSLPLMSVSITWGVRRRDEVTSDEARAEVLSGYKICRKGELVINRMRAFQGALGVAPADGIVSPDYAVLRPRPDLNAAWLAAVMKTEVFVAEMTRRVKGVGSVDLGSARTPRINVSDLGKIRVSVPSLSNQAAEVDEFQAGVREIQTVVAETEKFIELSRERRSALITAAVTGQIDAWDEVA